MLAKSKLNSIETSISQALTDMDQKEFITILNEKDKYEKMKDKYKKYNQEIKKRKTKE